MKFELNRSDFPKAAGTIGNARENAEVKFFFARINTTSKRRLGISIRGDLAEKYFPQKKITADVCESAGIRRLYILEDAKGYVLRVPSKNGTTRAWARINIPSEKPFYPYIGSHDLKYDRDNDAFYVEL